MCSSEYFRTPDNVMLPDTRCKHLSIEQIHSELLQYTLDLNVPAHIITEFETAKNLYLYTWFVYEFLAVADRQTLATLEGALKTRLDELNIARKEKDDLWKLLLKAEQQALIDWKDLPEDIAQTSLKPQPLSKCLKKIVKAHLSGNPVGIDLAIPRTEDMSLQLPGEAANPLPASQAIMAMEECPALPTGFTLLKFSCALINAIYTVH